MPLLVPALVWLSAYLVGSIPFGYLVKAQSACLTWGGPRAPDTEVAGALSGLSGKLMLPMGWGQYAIWHFSPGLKVSFDGRRETVYSQARIAELHGLVEGDLRQLRAGSVAQAREHVRYRVGHHNFTSSLS